ncbi:MAG: phosphoribosylformylglycinamidine synthase subunit PurQ, partial [Clostridia bacterium]|nr:phosphoribosylformylglycinamidine synthase subunit PurQ [Clostridia bacterium]
AISESQERMAVVVSAKDDEKLIRMSREENLEATTVAVVRAEKRVKIYWRKKTIVDISRDFLNTNGASQYATARILSPKKETSYFNTLPKYMKCLTDSPNDLQEAWFANLSNLNHCSQRGLVEMFDSSIGANTVLMPLGGKYQLSPQEGMAAKIPVYEGTTTTGTLMSYGYNPEISCWSPFHGAIFAILESCAKITAMGGNYKNIRLTFQEYFEKLGNDPEKWGQPLAALLGAYVAQMNLKLPSIGGKDSMSGTFKDISVPPTLVSFAVNVVDDVSKIVSAEFKGSDNSVVVLELPLDENHLPDFKQLDKNYSTIYSLIQDNKILSARSIRSGGIAAAISEMSFGNMIGFNFNCPLQPTELFAPMYGSILLEISKEHDLNILFKNLPYQLLGTTTENATITTEEISIPLDIMRQKWEKPLERIFPTKVNVSEKSVPLDGSVYSKNNSNPTISKPRISSVSPTLAKPRVFIPVFPGTNCEYDTEKAFIKAGAIVDTLVIKNLTSSEIKESLEIMAKKISQAQIIAFPGGFSAGDEPDGSGKFIAATFRNPKIEEAVMNLLKQRDGLILGICNGFQALIKLGLVPYGEIRPIDKNCPTLTYNVVGRHISKLLYTKVTSKLSPWFNNVDLGDTHILPVSHGEGRFIANRTMLDKLFAKGQVATQYVDLDGKPTDNMDYNPNGSVEAIEGITSPDGRVFGKMAHNERITSNTAKNIPGNKNQGIFEAGVRYFK